MTVADLRAGKGRRRFTRVTAHTAEEAAAAQTADIEAGELERFLERLGS